MYERNDVVRQFEETIAKYCGAPYAVAVESCSAALFLCCLYYKVGLVTIPRKTYFSVPMAIFNAGGDVHYANIDWCGAYQLWPYPIVDSAMRFKRGMYQKGNSVCLSFQYSKHIPIGRGGMILTDDKEQVDWLRVMRNDGRREVPKDQDKVKQIGWNAYMTAEQAARGLELFYWRIHGKKDQPDLPMSHGDISHVRRELR